MKKFEINEIPEKILKMCDALDGAPADLARKYRTLRAPAQRSRKEELARQLTRHFTPEIWMCLGKFQHYARIGSAKSEAKAVASRANGKLGGRPAAAGKGSRKFHESA